MMGLPLIGNYWPFIVIAEPVMQAQVICLVDFEALPLSVKVASNLITAEFE